MQAPNPDEQAVIQATSMPVAIEIPEVWKWCATVLAAGLVLNLGLGFNPGFYMLRGLAPWLLIGDYAPLSR